MTQQSQESGRRHGGAELFVICVYGAGLVILITIAVCLSTMPAHIGQATVTAPTVQSDGATHRLTEWTRIERAVQP